MSRSVEAAVETALNARLNRPVFLVKMELPDELILYATSAPFSVSWDGETWLPMDAVVTSFGQTQNGTAQAQISFPGHNNPLPVYIAAGNHLNRSADVYMAYLDENGNVLVDPELLISGIMSGGSVNDSGCNFTVLEDRTIRYGSAPRRWFSAENGFNNLPRDGQVIWWKGMKIKLVRRGEG